MKQCQLDLQRRQQEQVKTKRNDWNFLNSFHCLLKIKKLLQMFSTV